MKIELERQLGNDYEDTWIVIREPSHECQKSFFCSNAKNVNKFIIYCCLKPIHKVGNNIASLLLVAFN
jgi:hypothetical protein